MLLLQPSDLLRTIMYSNFLAFAIKLILQSYLNVLLRYSLMTLACEYLLQNGMFIVVLTTFVDVNFILLMASAYNFKCFMSFIKIKPYCGPLWWIVFLPYTVDILFPTN